MNKRYYTPGDYSGAFHVFIEIIIKTILMVLIGVLAFTGNTYPELIQTIKSPMFWYMTFITAFLNFELFCFRRKVRYVLLKMDNRANHIFPLALDAWSQANKEILKEQEEKGASKEDIEECKAIYYNRRLIWESKQETIKDILDIADSTVGEHVFFNKERFSNKEQDND